jgi:hypothetical protein
MLVRCNIGVSASAMYMKQKISSDLHDTGKFDVTELKYNKIRIGTRISQTYLNTGSVSSQAQHHITHSFSGIRISGSYLAR